MRKWPFAILVVLFVTTLLHSWLAWPSSSAEDKKAGASGAKWAYKVVPAKDNPADTEKTLNQLGAEGWELSSTVLTRASMGAGGEAPRFPPQQFAPNLSLNMQTQLILRRPKR